MSNTMMPRRSFLLGAASTTATLANPFARAAVVSGAAKKAAAMALPAIGSLPDFLLVFLGNQVPEVFSKGSNSFEVNWNASSLWTLEQLMDPESYFERFSSYSELERLLDQGYSPFFKHAPKEIKIAQLFDPRNDGVMSDLADKMSMGDDRRVTPEQIKDGWLSVLKAVSAKRPELGTLEDLLEFDFSRFYEEIYQPTVIPPNLDGVCSR